MAGAAAGASTERAGDEAPAGRRRWRTAALLAGCAVLFLAGADRIGVVDRDEARFALAVREMAERGDWIVPTNWGELRFQKPILAYWLAGASRELIGPSPLTLRLPSAVCATLAVLLTAAAARCRFGEVVGWRAGWILASSMLVVVEAGLLGAGRVWALWSRRSGWARWQQPFPASAFSAARPLGSSRQCSSWARSARPRVGRAGRRSAGAGVFP